MKKIKISSELAYAAALFLVSLSSAMIIASDIGISVLGALQYILCRKFTFFSYGQWEYVIEGVLFVIFCVIMGKVKLLYFGSFITGVIFGTLVDFWRMVVPILNPNVTAVGSFSMPGRLALFFGGELICALAIAIFFHSYLCPQVYELFVKGISEKYKLDMAKFKLCFDLSFLLFGFAATLVLFGKIEGIGVGTVVIAAINGPLIGLFNKALDARLIFVPTFPRLKRYFELN